MICVRRAVMSDRRQIETLLKNSWLENWAPHLRPETVARFHVEDPVGGYLDACLPDIYVAAEGARVEGMCHFEAEMLHALHINAEAQGMGVGSRLLAFAEAEGASKLEVRGFNRRARAFYASRGWREARCYEGHELGEPVETIEMRTDRGTVRPA